MLPLLLTVIIGEVVFRVKASTETVVQMAISDYRTERKIVDKEISDKVIIHDKELQLSRIELRDELRIAREELRDELRATREELRIRLTRIDEQLVFLTKSFDEHRKLTAP